MRIVKMNRLVEMNEGWLVELKLGKMLVENE